WTRDPHRWIGAFGTVATSGQDFAPLAVRFLAWLFPHPEVAAPLLVCGLLLGWLVARGGLRAGGAAPAGGGPAAGGRPGGRLGVASLPALATLVFHAPAFRHPFLDGDEATYSAVAVLMNAGGVLYADGGVDNKFPGIYWTYAMVFRLAGRYAMQTVHALAL